MPAKIQAVIGVAVFCALVTACGLRRNVGTSEDLLIKGCILPKDQAETLSGKWTKTPIPIAFHQGDFSVEEKAEIATAVDTWNKFYSASLGLRPLDIGSTGTGYYVSSAAHPTSLCTTSILQNGAFVQPVVIYKMGAWPYPTLPTAIALTTFCPDGTTPLPGFKNAPFKNAMMELNYQNFFVADRKLPDLQTIVLHELGHVVGLNHSCEGISAVGMPGCEDFGTALAYGEAVMAPKFAFDTSGYGEQKRNLRENDQGRANCLYDPNPVPSPGS